MSAKVAPASAAQISEPKKAVPAPPKVEAPVPKPVTPTPAVVTPPKTAAPAQTAQSEED